jgi:hypothetical protein
MLGMNEFEGNVPTGRNFHRLEDGPHSAAAKLAQQPVVANDSGPSVTDRLNVRRRGRSVGRPC